MPLSRLLVTTGAAALLAIAPTFGEPPAPGPRHTITAVTNSSITVKERDGRTFALKTGPTTVYAEVVPSSLDAVKVHDYIGTAVKGQPAQWIAVEIVLVPESMRAGRKGDYPWDTLPDTTWEVTAYP